MQIFPVPSGLIELRFGEYLPRSVGHAVKHGVFSMVEVYFLACHEHAPVLVIDLQLSDTQHGGDWGSDADHLRHFAIQRVHDSLEHAAARVSGPDNDDFIHDFTPNGKGRRPSARPPPFAVLTILVSRQLSASRNSHH